MVQGRQSWQHQQHTGKIAVDTAMVEERGRREVGKLLCRLVDAPNVSACVNVAEPRNFQLIMLKIDALGGGV